MWVLVIHFVVTTSRLIYELLTPGECVCCVIATKNGKTVYPRKDNWRFKKRTVLIGLASKMRDVGNAGVDWVCADITSAKWRLVTFSMYVLVWPHNTIFNYILIFGCAFNTIFGDKYTLIRKVCRFDGIINKSLKNFGIEMATNEKNSSSEYTEIMWLFPRTIFYISLPRLFPFMEWNIHANFNYKEKISICDI